MRKKPYIILRFFPFAALIASCGSHASGPAKNAPVNQFNAVPAVEGFVVKPTVIDQSIAISGTLKPFEETVLMPDVAGRVVTINLPEGKFVKQGTLLVKLFDGDLQANLKKSNAQLDIAEQTEKRQAELLKVKRHKPIRLRPGAVAGALDQRRHRSAQGPDTQNGNLCAVRRRDRTEKHQHRRPGHSRHADSDDPRGATS